MSKVIIYFATRFGHTQRIAQHISDTITAQGIDAQCVNLLEDDAPIVTADDFIVIGVPVFYGKHYRQAVAKLNALVPEYAKHNTALFSVNLTARKPEKCTVDTSPYYQKLLPQLSFTPAVGAVFAGQLNYPAYGWFDKSMIRFIMKLTKGNTDGVSVESYTDWDAVTQFGEQVVAKFRASHA